MQRRFQKIVEEGPPIAVAPDTMRDMELAAAKLALMVDYTHAGTVECVQHSFALVPESLDPCSCCLFLTSSMPWHHNFIVGTYSWKRRASFSSSS